MNDTEVPGYPPDGIRNGPNDKRRECILARLGEFFPSGADSHRMLAYLEQLKKHQFRIRDVREGVERVISTHEHRTFPAFATVLAACRDARRDRMQAEAQNADRERDIATRPWQPEDLELFRELRKAYGMVTGEKRKSEMTPIADILGELKDDRAQKVNDEEPFEF